MDRDTGSSLASGDRHSIESPAALWVGARRDLAAKCAAARRLTTAASLAIACIVASCTNDLIVGGQLAGPCIPVTEICQDGIDNDCDGRIDEPPCEVSAPATAPPSPLDCPANVLQISAKVYHICAIIDDGGLWCWGANSQGQLGLGTTGGEQATPVHVRPGTRWRSISTGYLHTCGVQTDGTAWCWGHNSFGQLGTGDTAPRAEPTAVGSERSWVQIEATQGYTCAVRANGVPSCWGLNVEGSLGRNADAAVDPATGMAPVAGATAISLVRSSIAHSCARGIDGSLTCWGNGDVGQLGTGSTVGIGPPTRIQLASPVVSHGVRTSSTCAVLQDGSLWCWGELADGTHASPFRIEGFSDWEGVDPMARCAWRAGGRIHCWAPSGVDAPAFPGDQVAGIDDTLDVAATVGPNRWVLKRDRSLWQLGGPSPVRVCIP